MPHHHARLVAVAIASVSFSTPITAQQERRPPPTLEARVETLGGGGWSGAWLRKRTGGCCRTLVGDQITDARLAHLRGLTALERLWLSTTDVTDEGLAHLAGLTALESLILGGVPVTDAGLVQLSELTGLKSLVMNDTVST